MVGITTRIGTSRLECAATKDTVKVKRKRRRRRKEV
tara:strand:- start:144 stop:251 length:108 start_codon:yes stop_codon:yes gene_type:complete